jgi:hypothetical protein
MIVPDRGDLILESSKRRPQIVYAQDGGSFRSGGARKDQ